MVPAIDSFEVELMEETFWENIAAKVTTALAANSIFDY